MGAIVQRVCPNFAVSLAAGTVLLAGVGLLSLSGFASRAADAQSDNLVEQLQQRLNAGTSKLAYDDTGHGYLPAVLKAFQIARDSQLLVFSASSLQFDRINQKTPRAIYYDDDVAVGSVQGGRFIEVVVTDKNSGVAFYTLDVKKSDAPRFVRRTSECIICHGFASRWAPGLMVASFRTGPEGQLLNLDPNHVFRLTDDRTPFEDRYGGWYVTGVTGKMRHEGNITFDPSNASSVPQGGLNVTSLANRIDTSRYLEPGSDIVSLLTLEHQSGFVNLATRINAQYRGLDNDKLVPALQATKQDIDTSIDEMVSYMTFVDEVPLPSPVKGSSSFEKNFCGEGPRDGEGRSLRDFDLQTRLLRYPLSYMIYSQAFDDLNPQARDRILRRLYAVLSGADHSPPFASLRDRGGVAAINILAATKPGLPAYWKAIPEPRSRKS
jgi:hypothetical protein